MKGLRYLAAAATIVCLGVSPVSAFTKCKMPDGRTMFVDNPPPGCVVEREIANPSADPESAPAPSEGEESATASPDSGDAQAIAARRRIERELNAAAADLERLREEAANAPKKPPGIYVYTDGSGGEMRDKEFTDPAVAVKLKEREEVVLKRIDNLKAEFDGLTRDLASRHGGAAPSWWNPPRCRGCP